MAAGKLDLFLNVFHHHNQPSRMVGELSCSQETTLIARVEMEKDFLTVQPLTFSSAPVMAARDCRKKNITVCTGDGVILGKDSVRIIYYSILSYIFLDFQYIADIQCAKPLFALFSQAKRNASPSLKACASVHH